jgi:hypothetical protein
MTALPYIALSIRQPWAWLIVNNWKNIENRPWSTRFRGPVLIHAGKTMTRGDYDACLFFVDAVFPKLASAIPSCELLERGGIVGVATVIDCVDTHPSEWFCGDYGFVMADARPLPFQACKGRLGFFKIDNATRRSRTSPES